MATYEAYISIFFICFLSLACINNAATVTLGQVAASERRSLLSDRSDLNFTSLTNATTIVQDLDFTANCTVAILWHDNLQPVGQDLKMFEPTFTPSPSLASTSRARTCRTKDLISPSQNLA
jgi:hypothetical protein